MYSIDPLYILLSLPALVLVVIAQLLVRYFYSKYANAGNSMNINGLEVVEKIASTYNFDIKVGLSQAELSDHYNPLKSELILSERVARQPSIASIGIAAHEMGHVLQHKEGNVLLTVRNLLVPVVNIGTFLGYLLFVIGIAFQLFNVVVLGIIFFSLSTLFTFLTLPIEIDASVKALNMIRTLGIASEYELGGVKKVLFAASLTYIASVFQSLTSLLYYILRAFGMRRSSRK